VSTALVTGGAGFLGSHLCERLLGQGTRVICLDNFHTGRQENIAGLAGDRNFELIEHDITVPLEAQDLPAVPDTIFNLACPASPVHYQQDPVRTIRSNVHGTMNLLELARACDAAFLQASTSEVYGDPECSPQPESYHGRVNPIGPRSCYDEGKRCAETLCFDYHRQYQVPVRVARIFNCYGPRMLIDDGRVVSNFIVQALRGEPLVLFGDGEQTRSFCYVDDMVDGLCRLAAGPLSFTGPVNLGNPEEITIRQLAEQISALVGTTARFEHAPLPQDDPLQRKPDSTLARTALGWSPKVGLEEGLQRTVADFRSRLPAATIHA